jgi:hypothetical protein
VLGVALFGLREGRQRGVHERNRTSRAWAWRSVSAWRDGPTRRTATNRAARS